MRVSSRLRANRLKHSLPRHDKYSVAIIPVLAWNALVEPTLSYHNGILHLDCASGRPTLISGPGTAFQATVTGRRALARPQAKSECVSFYW